MPSDDDCRFEEAFEKLHRRRGEQAPPFGLMRERALRPARAASPARGERIVWLRAAAFAVVLMVAAGLWWRGAGRDSEPAITTAESATAPQVEQLLDSIEEQIELNETLTFPTYPTDLLLTQYHPETTP